MKTLQEKNRFAIAMDTLNATSESLSRASGVDSSLITKWRRGDRKLTGRSKTLRGAAEGMLALDTDGALAEYYAPYRENGENDTQAMLAYLLDTEITGMQPQAAPPKRQTKGRYVAQYRVYLGEREFRRATLTMMDYLLSLPPGREIVVLCHGRYDLMIKNLPFVFQFILKLRKALKRDTRLLLVNRKGYSVVDTAAFTNTWLTAHLKGYIRSRYYEGGLPSDLRYAASIRGYWAARVEEDAEVEDGLYTEMLTDPKYIRRVEQICDEYIAKSKPASQYQFLEHPCGGGENEKLWSAGPLPKWSEPDSAPPRGNFHAVCRVPGFGIMTQKEFHEILGADAPPDIPDYLFGDGCFAPGAHRIILCREDIQEGLKKERRMHEPLSALLHRRAFATRELLAKQLSRLMDAMNAREDFEVALVPRTAFLKLQTEMICFDGSVSAAWLQDMSESVFADDKATSGSFHGSVGYTWDKLMAGWKRRRTVLTQLRKWLSGKELDKQEADSAVVKNWDVLPRK
jgi:transcriptional regulator with XRE-family HTH domain